LENREAVREILKMDEFIDLIIPRGSNKFVKYIQDNTKIAVLGHSGGICHVYVDKDANFNKAMRIAIDAKCQYPAVCNAMETLLVHRDIAKRFLPAVVKKYLENKVEVRLDNEGLKIVNMGYKLIRKASGRDWGTEYNDLIISIKIVGSVNEAVEHINKYGSRHTDGIVTENKKTAFYFMEIVDSGSVMWNASTRFSDGYRYGLGAEVGISTGKIHARGPVGLEGLTTYKYRLMGDGQIVADYSGKNAKRFTHKKLK
jgi:glutamate-5-semialdehyde dehydrogenase